MSHKNLYLYYSSFDPFNENQFNVFSYLSSLKDSLVYFVISKDGYVSKEHRKNLIKIFLDEYEINEDSYRIVFEEDLSKEDLSIYENKYFIGAFIDYKRPIFKGFIYLKPFKNEEETNKLTLPFERVDLKEITSYINRLEKLYLLSSKEITYLEENKLYFLEKIAKELTPHRYSHSLSVAHLAAEITLSNGYYYPLVAYKAGIIHDIAKSLPKEEAYRLMRELHPEYLDFPSWTYHQFLAIDIARKYFKVDKTLEAGIKYHSTGKARMSLLGKIIYASDKIEPTRDYDSSEMTNACLKDFKSGWKLVVYEVKKFLLEKGYSIDNRLSKDFFEYYLKEKI